MELGKIAKKTLDTLPLNGSKTKLGGLITGLGLLQAFLPDVIATLAANPTPVGLGLMALGVLHKFLKGKYPSLGSF